MRSIFFVFFMMCASVAWCQEWRQGVVTRDAWVDQGGFHVEVNGTRYLFMRAARIKIGSSEHEVPDRAMWLTEKSKVRILYDGFRIYDLELIWRNR
jgi:hypothetical protein